MLGGATIVLYGLVGILGVRIWLTNHVDFALPVNQMTAAIPLIIGIADFTWHIGDLTFTGIALGRSRRWSSITGCGACACCAA